jgi:hypothetical protein
METLENQFKRSLALRRVVMRRVWYVYALSIMLRPAVVLGFVFGASAIAFWRLVSITSIVENLLRVEIGQLPWYTTHAFLQADTAALLAFLGLAGVSFVVIFRFVKNTPTLLVSQTV